MTNPNTVMTLGEYLNGLPPQAQIALVKGNHIFTPNLDPADYPGARVHFVKLLAPGHPHDGALLAAHTGGMADAYAEQQAGKPVEVNIEQRVLAGLLELAKLPGSPFDPAALRAFVDTFPALPPDVIAAEVSIEESPRNGCTNPDCPIHGPGVSLEKYLNLIQQQVPHAYAGIVRGWELLAVDIDGDDYPPEARIKNNRLVAPGDEHDGALVVIDSGDQNFLRNVWNTQQNGGKAPYDLEQYALDAFAAAARNRSNVNYAPSTHD